MRWLRRRRPQVDSADVLIDANGIHLIGDDWELIFSPDRYSRHVVAVVRSDR